MSAVSVPLDIVQIGFEVPNSLKNHITSKVWIEICTAKSESIITGNCLACGAEWFCCLVCIPLLPFLFHCCASKAATEFFFKKKLALISRNNYYDSDVIDADTNSLYVYTHMIPPLQTNFATATPISSPSTGQSDMAFVYDNPILTPSNNPLANTATGAASSNNIFRLMKVRIPDDAIPGSTILVNSPENSLVEEAQFSGHCCVCGVEWLCCIVVIPLVPFLFHFCASKAVIECFFRQKLANIGRDFYSHPGALDTDSNLLYVYTDIIPRLRIPLATATQINTPSLGQTEMTFSHKNPIVRPSTVPITTTAITTAPAYVGTHNNHASKWMKVCIPDDAIPGSTIVVRSPEGSLVQVTLPSDIKLGTEIDVRY